MLPRLWHERLAGKPQMAAWTPIGGHGRVTSDVRLPLRSPDGCSTPSRSATGPAPLSECTCRRGHRWSRSSVQSGRPGGSPLRNSVQTGYDFRVVAIQNARDNDPPLLFWPDAFQIHALVRRIDIGASSREGHLQADIPVVSRSMRATYVAFFLTSQAGRAAAAEGQSVCGL